jgi:hypothetical protein
MGLGIVEVLKVEGSHELGGLEVLHFH